MRCLSKMMCAGGVEVAQHITDRSEVRLQQRDDMKPKSVRISDHNYHGTLAILLNLFPSFFIFSNFCKMNFFFLLPLTRRTSPPSDRLYDLRLTVLLQVHACMHTILCYDAYASDFLFWRSGLAQLLLPPSSIVAHCRTIPAGLPRPLLSLVVQSPPASYRRESPFHSSATRLHPGRS